MQNDKDPAKKADPTVGEPMAVAAETTETKKTSPGPQKSQALGDLMSPEETTPLEPAKSEAKTVKPQSTTADKAEPIRNGAAAADRKNGETKKANQAGTGTAKPGEAKAPAAKRAQKPAKRNGKTGNGDKKKPSTTAQLTGGISLPPRRTKKGGAQVKFFLAAAAVAGVLVWLTVFSNKDKEPESQTADSESMATEEQMASTELSVDELTEIESLLAQLAFDPGAADGLIDGQAEAAIRLYQGVAELPVDGQPSRALLLHLREVVEPIQSNQ